MIYRFITIFFVTFSALTQGQTIDSLSYSINPRYSFFSPGEDAELLLYIPQNHIYSAISVNVNFRGDTICEWNGKPGKNIIRLKFVTDTSWKSGKAEAEIHVQGQKQKMYYCSCDIIFLKHKPNEVKIDRLTGGLIVNGLPFFPFGFYTYSPVYPTLPEEEAVKGFNLISPYQRLLPESLGERKKYMDRCAQLGMKVNYNLASVAGGGGVDSKANGMSDEEKCQVLINEVKTFMDHPALLSWYIADEPDGHRIPPAYLEEIYKTVKETDPWHPVTIVFMTPFTKSKDYAGATDIVMADPYPVPVYPVAMAGNATRMLKKEFEYRKPVWIVPQAFGGGEHWLREPTIQEIRSMTWQAIAEGATGIQYFIREGLNAFPKSTATWNECGRMAIEVNTIVPWLFSDEESIPVSSSSSDIIVTSRMYRGQLVIISVNKTAFPRPIQISISRNINTRARVLFENRTIQVTSGIINDYIQSYGSQVYKININPQKEKVIPFRNNLITDPGFEDLSSPGVPSACYARPGTDRGATYFTDPRVVFEGNHSLRLITPVENGGVTLRFYPIKVMPGKRYMVSIWAKADPDQRFLPGHNPEEGNLPPQFVEAGINGFATARFVPEKDWKQFVTFVTIPQDTVPEIKANVILRMPGQGVAWFDMLQVIEDPLFKE